MFNLKGERDSKRYFSEVEDKLLWKRQIIICENKASSILQRLACTFLSNLKFPHHPDLLVKRIITMD
jgi:hypothetical protein